MLAFDTDAILQFCFDNYILCLVVFFCCCCWTNIGIPRFPLKFEDYPDNNVTAIISEDQWRQILVASSESGSLVVVDFFATWCPPCARACPIFGKMSTEYEGVTFLKVDIDTNKSIAEGSSIRAMPTFVLLKGGLEVERCVGFNENSIRAMLNRHVQK